ncbi:MAG TPA: pyridoxamine 5'-phosphate oxidase family protein [Pirellulales bacterium]|nr:pyridoxamine 5'-phosphate oxidase family protein [Pirellulales bacterium]
MTAPNTRSQVRRLAKRAVYDRAAIEAILDEGLICHVGFVADGQPFVIPTIHVRIGDSVYLHGSPASRMLQTLAAGGEACLTVTLVDGLVLARSAFHHSMNYRSVVLFGRGSPVEDERQKLDVLNCLSEHLIQGRWAEVRSPNPNELKGTLVVRIPIDEVSAKVRTGPPLDDEEDYALTVWAGVLPLRLAASLPVADPRLPADIPVPGYASDYRGPRPAR